jgi:hypothetical protein
VAQRGQPAGFYWAGFLYLVFGALKLTVERQWSWWRVLLPLWVVLGHNIVYIAVGFVWLSFDMTEEEIAIHQGHRADGYQLAALLCFVIFGDNVLRRIEGPGEGMWHWVSSGKWDLIFVSGILSVALHLLFWFEVVSPAHRRSHGN